MQLSVVGLLQILAAANPSQNAGAPATRAQLDSSATVNAVISAQETFIAKWRLEWLRGDWYRWIANGRPSAARAQLDTFTYAPERECAPVTPLRRGARNITPSAPPTRPAGAMIAPSCPGWTRRGDAVPDASIVLDSALTPARRIRIARARDSLLSVVRAAANSFPRDQFLIMQHVRVLLDQSYRSRKYLDEAARVANRCDVHREFCESLRGLVYARRGVIDSAAKSFAIMQAAVNTEDYCFQDNTLGLMPMLEGGAFPNSAPSCQTRVAMNERYWWLADPLWSDSINERRVEHDVRNMSRTLAGSFPQSERFDWMPKRSPYYLNNSEAYSQLVTRYGWPSQMTWPVAPQHKEIGMGDSTTRERFRPGVDPIASMQSPPATTLAYNASGRIHTGPSWNALLSPYTANTTDWHLDASTDVNGNPAWAIEHFKRNRPLYDIADWQTQTWRRRDSLVVAIAAKWPNQASGTYSAVLVRSTGVGDATPIARANSSTSKPTAFRVTLPIDSSLLSLELIGLGALKSDARLRFALLPESPLSALDSGEVAQSTPVLVRAAAMRNARISADDAAASMHATTRIRENRVGLYWELYGFRESDTVQTTLHVERSDALGKLVRVTGVSGGSARRLVGRQPSWSSVLLSGQVAFAASAILDVSSLRPGAYVVTIASQTRDGRGALSWRAFTMLPRN